MVQEHQSGVASYHRLQGCGIGSVEGIFRSCDVLPFGDVLVRTCRETDEPIAIVLCKLVYLVYSAEVGIVGVSRVGEMSRKV